LGHPHAPRYQLWLEAFRHGLREHGWVEGQNVAVEYHFAEEHGERLADLAAELVRLPVDVLIGAGEPVIRALQHATSTVPIVMAISGDPVGSGFVASLARPGGNITGLSIQTTEVGGKRLELLKQAVPQASRVAGLWSAGYRTHVLVWQDTQVAARALGVTLQAVEVDGPAAFDGALAVIARERPDALIVFADPLTNARQSRIVEFATQHRLPMVSTNKAFALAGALMSYGASELPLFRRAAFYVDRLLRGTKPADLPVEQPWTFELVINLKTAQALGITMPPSLLILADEVIQ
jgi:putative ABC transport system substrate-binding protein